MTIKAQGASIRRHWHHSHRARLSPLYGIQLHMDLMEVDHDLNDEDAAQKELDTAKAQISGLDERGADRASFLRLRAQIKMNSGDADGGLSDMKEALAISPHDPNNLQLTGDLLMKLGRTEDAIAAYKQVLDIDSRNRSSSRRL